MTRNKPQLHAFRLPALLLLASLGLGACATSDSGSTYGRGESRREMSVRMGVVESVRNITLDGSESGAGTLAGAAIGGIAGSNVGGGKGSSIGAILGAVAGGIAGHAAEGGITKKQGLEITVKVDGGGIVAIVQEADEAFRPGERVRLLSNGGKTRVSH